MARCSRVSYRQLTPGSCRLRGVFSRFCLRPPRRVATSFLVARKKEPTIQAAMMACLSLCDDMNTNSTLLLVRCSVSATSLSRSACHSTFRRAQLSGYQPGEGGLSRPAEYGRSARLVRFRACRELFCREIGARQGRRDPSSRAGKASLACRKGVAIRRLLAPNLRVGARPPGCLIG